MFTAWFESERQNFFTFSPRVLTVNQAWRNREKELYPIWLTWMFRRMARKLPRIYHGSVRMFGHRTISRLRKWTLKNVDKCKHIKILKRYLFSWTFNMRSYVKNSLFFTRWSMKFISLSDLERKLRSFRLDYERRKRKKLWCQVASFASKVVKRRKSFPQVLWIDIWYSFMWHQTPQTTARQRIRLELKLIWVHFIGSFYFFLAGSHLQLISITIFIEAFLWSHWSKIERRMKECLTLSEKKHFNNNRSKWCSIDDKNNGISLESTSRWI